MPPRKLTAEQKAAEAKAEIRHDVWGRRINRKNKEAVDQWKWEIQFARLLDYKNRFGDCMVPVVWNENPQLAHWVSMQRALYNKGRWKFPQERIDRLNAVGFSWKAGEKFTWDERFEQLKQYKSKNGTTIVTESFYNPENLALARWAGCQRTYFRKKNFRFLTKERIDKLNSIDFIWEPDDALWEEKFGELVKYKKQHGHCVLPTDSKKYPILANWTKHQRTKYKKGKLTKYRIDKLRGVGFSFSAPTKAEREAALGLDESVDIVYPGRYPKGESPRHGAKEGAKQAKKRKRPASATVPSAKRRSRSKRMSKRYASSSSDDDMSSLKDALLDVDSDSEKKPEGAQAKKRKRPASAAVPSTKRRSRSKRMSKRYASSSSGDDTSSLKDALLDIDSDSEKKPSARQSMTQDSVEISSETDSQDKTVKKHLSPSFLKKTKDTKQDNKDLQKVKARGRSARKK